MRTLFSTVNLDQKNSFRQWRETIFERIVPLEQTKLGEGDFVGSIEAADVGGVRITRTSTSAVRSEATPSTIRRYDGNDTLLVGIMLGGMKTNVQDGREAVHRAGDLVVLDRRPVIAASVTGSQGLAIEVPRERLEHVLGSTRLYTALPIRADQASSSLVTTFFNELVRVHEALNSASAARMASIGIDLIVAAIAERLAQEVPKPLHGTVVVQRAKAYVEAHLGDPALDPPRLAAAVGVSLRHLQELFRERGRHISDWIWQRRLEVAAQRLADRGHAHLSIGMLAYGCGFISQAHFARRFKERYGLTPTEFRQERATAFLAD